MIGVERRGNPAGAVPGHASLQLDRERPIAHAFDVGLRHAAEARLRDVDGRGVRSDGFGREQHTRQRDVLRRALSVERLGDRVLTHRHRCPVVRDDHVRHDERHVGGLRDLEQSLAVTQQKRREVHELGDPLRQPLGDLADDDAAAAVADEYHRLACSLDQPADTVGPAIE